jgi:hypothetical protein
MRSSSKNLKISSNIAHLGYEMCKNLIHFIHFALRMDFLIQL